MPLHTGEALLEELGPGAVAAGLAAVMNWLTVSEKTVHLFRSVGELDAAARLATTIKTVDHVIEEALTEFDRGHGPLPDDAARDDAHDSSVIDFFAGRR